MKYLLMATLIVVESLAGPAVVGDLAMAAAQSCESLTSLRLPNTTITLAQTIEGVRLMTSSHFSTT